MRTSDKDKRRGFVPLLGRAALAVFFCTAFLWRCATIMTPTHCTDCKIYLREDLIEEQVMPMIMDLIEYDMTVKKYFYPVLADKKERNTAKLDKEISSLQSRKNRIKEAYLKEIVDVEEFSKEYKEVDEKLNLLEQKRIEAIDLNRQTFSPQHLMADRDVEKEKLIRSNKFYDMLMAEWKNKDKEEKQEFISKFLESITVEKDKKGKYELVNMKLRKTFIEQIYKLMQNGMFDMTIADEKDKEVRTTVMMDKQELQDYIERLNEYYEVSYYEVARLDEQKKGYQKKYLTIDEINDNGEKLFKLVELVTGDKKYPHTPAPSAASSGPGKQSGTCGCRPDHRKGPATSHTRPWC